MARKYVWTVEIEIDAVEVEKHLTFKDGLAFNDATAYDMVADGLLSESPGNTFKARSVKLRRPDAHRGLAFGLQYSGSQHTPLAIVK